MSAPAVRRLRRAHRRLLLALTTALAVGRVLPAQPAAPVQSADTIAPAPDTTVSKTTTARPDRSSSHAEAPTVTAAPVKASGITLDGRLDDAAWAAATPAVEFRQTDPIDGADATERTEVRILYDDEAVYVGARLLDASGRVSSRLGRRDTDLPDSDWFIVVFDSYHDHTGGFRFKVNPAGVIGDEANGDRSWNPVWSVETSVDGGGWSAELRIPFSQLRFSSASEQLWGVQFIREIRSKAERLVFSYSPRSEPGGPARFGHLVGLREIKRGKTLEVLPYVAASSEFKAVPQRDGTAFRNPFRDGSDHFRQVGADVKLRVTSNFTVDATLNPDFGQIEADESQVNLSANELFVREQRPFFVEGGSMFRFGTGVSGNGGGTPQLFYSRRVGRAPQGSVPGVSRYSDMPVASTILGAAKLTGRTAGGWTIGLMEAVTGRESAPWVDSLATRHRTEVEPRSNYLVARVKRDLREGQSNVGGIFTSVHRTLGDSALALRLRSAAYVSGLDFGHTFAGRTWEVSGSVIGSLIDGSRQVITAAQRASARFHQRPDAAHLAVDSAATSMTGWTGGLGIAKTAGLHWTGEVRANVVSPGFEINDLGFLNTSDRMALTGGLNYDENRPGQRWRRWGVSLRPELRANFGGDIVDRRVTADIDGQLLNFIGGRINVSHDLSAIDDRLTRGGPLAMSVAGTNVSVNLNSDGRQAYTWNVSASERWDAAGGWGQSRSLRFGFKPSDWWSGEIGPSYNRSHGAAQYVTSVGDTTARATFGRRYVFADIHQTSLSMQMRLNATFSPRLTFGFAAEPFLASGRYGAPKELRAPRSFAFDVYGAGAGTARLDVEARRFEIDPDGNGPAPAFTVADNSFNARSVNATGNLRWDWRPGSTLFLVWQHRRSNPATFGDFRLRRDARGIFEQRSENTLLFKFSYWLNP